MELACRVCGNRVGPGGRRRDRLCARCYKRVQREALPAPEPLRASVDEGDRRTFSLPRSVSRRIKGEADRHGITISRWLRRVVEDHLDGASNIHVLERLTPEEQDLHQKLRGAQQYLGEVAATCARKGDPVALVVGGATSIADQLLGDFLLAVADDRSPRADLLLRALIEVSAVLTSAAGNDGGIEQLLAAMRHDAGAWLKNQVGTADEIPGEFRGVVELCSMGRARDGVNTRRHLQGAPNDLFEVHHDVELRIRTWLHSEPAVLAVLQRPAGTISLRTARLDAAIWGAATMIMTVGGLLGDHERAEGVVVSLGAAPAPQSPVPP